MNKDTINKILSETEQGYDLISGKFSQTRKSFWRELEFISDYAKEGDTVLDYGCGNGRLLEIMEKDKIDYTGADVSMELLKLAESRYAGGNIRFVKLDSSQASLPFEDNYFNAAYSIAVFHHLPDKKRREEIARELHRVLKPGGYLVVTVWNLWQSKYRKNIFANWKRKLVGKSELDWNDCRIEFKDNQGRVFSRYHHAFTLGELGRIFVSVGFKIEKAEAIEGRNLVCVCRKS